MEIATQRPILPELESLSVDRFLNAYGNVPKVLPDANTAGEVGQLIKMIRTFVNGLEGERKAITDHIREGVNGINAHYHTMTNPLHEAMRDLGARNTAFLKAQERLAREEAERQSAAEVERIEAAAEVGEVVNEAPVAVAEPKVLRGGAGAATGMRDNWTCTVIDASLLPPEYLLPNQAALNKAVKSDGVREIPGCRIENDRKAVTR